MAPLWKSMISKNGSIYRESLWSFSSSRGQAKEKVYVRMLLERDKELMLSRLKQ